MDSTIATGQYRTRTGSPLDGSRSTTASGPITSSGSATAPTRSATR